MTSLIRNILVLLVAAWLAVPTVCDEGGENNGGTGVWILPACANVTGLEPAGANVVRATQTFANTSKDIELRVENQMGCAAASCVDGVAGSPIALAVSGRIVVIPRQLLQALEQSSRSATIVITDAQQYGYVLAVQISADGKVKLSVY
jgi:hypothetical protein